MSQAALRLRASSSYGRGVVSLEPGPPEDLGLDDELIAEVSDVLQEILADSEFRQPLLPATALATLAAANSPDVSLREVARLLKVDPGLAAEVLRVGNSAFYTRSLPARTVQAALSRLGLSRLREVLLVACSGRFLRVPNDPGFGARLRRRSSAVAHVSQLVASEAGVNRDQAFTAGLLHDVGLAAFHALFPAVRRRCWSPALAEAETRRKLGAILHEEVGASLALHWNLPAPVVGAMGYHHRPKFAVRGVRMAWTVATACELVESDLGIPSEIDGPSQSGGGLHGLGLSGDAEERLHQALADLRARLAR
jgi:putative nucleotidyltransferase with HDIG domain